MHDPFPGFDDPTANFSKLPHSLIEAFPSIETVSELKVLLYVLRHTWGFGEYDGDGKRITLDEFANGRKRRDGSRLDGGTGLSYNAIRAGVRLAIKHGFLIREGDGRDAARGSHVYRLRMRPGDAERGSNFEPLDIKPCTPEVQTLNPCISEFEPRSEKDTQGRNKKKETSATPADDGDGGSSFNDFLSEVVSGLGLMVSEELRRRLADAFAADPDRLRGLLRYAMNTEGLTNPAGWWRKAALDGATAPDQKRRVRRVFTISNTGGQMRERFVYEDDGTPAPAGPNTARVLTRDDVVDPDEFFANGGQREPLPAPAGSRDPYHWDGSEPVEI